MLPDTPDVEEVCLGAHGVVCERLQMGVGDRYELDSRGCNQENLLTDHCAGRRLCLMRGCWRARRGPRIAPWTIMAVGTEGGFRPRQAFLKVIGKRITHIRCLQRWTSGQGL